MSEMIERVARDWFESQNDTSGATWETIYPEARAEIREFVRFVISAMREPTEAMVQAGGRECGPLDSRFETSETAAGLAWDVMISTALAEGEA